MLRADSTVVLYPEAIAAALKQRLHTAYVVYACAKSQDAKTGGRGLLTLNELLKLIQEVVGLGISQAYRVVKAGTGIFWRVPKVSKGVSVVGLLSHQNAYSELGVCMWPSRPVRVRLRQLGYSSGKYSGSQLKDALVAMVASWDNGHSPLSVACMSDLTGISRRSLQRHLRYAESLTDCGMVLKVFTTYRTMRDNLNQRLANDACTVLNARDCTRYRIEHLGSAFAVVCQGSNVYFLDGVERLGRRRRHKQLKLLLPNRPG